MVKSKYPNKGYLVIPAYVSFPKEFIGKRIRLKVCIIGEKNERKNKRT